MPYLLRLALLAVLAATPVAAEWTRIVSPHFELFTDAEPKKGREAILHFEQARDFFEKASPVSKPSNLPVRLILFNGDASYAPYRASSAAVAYFAGSRKRDYIVMGDTGDQVYRVALHEYMHLIVRHSGLRIPLWLSEGWADVYSTLRPTSKGVAIGDMLEDRVQVLTSTDWLTFDQLTSLTHDSPLYNEANRAGLFYAESWALVHMLYLAPDYRDGFPKFINALHVGKSAEEACVIAWNKHSAAVFAEVRSYLNRKKLFGTLFMVTIDKKVENPLVEPVAHLDSELMLADLLQATGRLDPAEKRFKALADEYPGRPGILESLGYLAWARGDTESTVRDFENAAVLGDSDPLMYFHLGILGRELQKPPERFLAALERAVELKPDYMEARLELGVSLLAQNRAGDALRHLLLIKAVDSEHASRLFNALAFAHAAQGDFEKARADAEKAKKLALREVDRTQAEEILREIARRAPPR